MPTLDQFLTVIRILLEVAESNNQEYLEINAGELHRFIGRYPNGGDHRMPVCNRAMRQIMDEGDYLVQEPPLGQGASLTIRYYFQRR